jgi:hypothetical protein
MKKILLISMIPACLLSTGLLAGGTWPSGRIAVNPEGNYLMTTSRMSNNLEPQSYPGQGLFFDLTPSYSRIYNKAIYDDDTWQADGGFGYALDFGYFMRFSRNIGLGIGIGISHYQTEIGYDYYHAVDEMHDIDGDLVESDLEVLNMAQKTSLMFADLPLFIELGNPNTHKLNFYVRLGIKLSYPFSYDFTSGGTSTTEGYYPEYFVNLYEIPELGFESNKSVVVTNETDLSSLNVSLLGSAGLTIPVSDYIIIKVGAALNYGLTEISDEKLEEGDQSIYTGESNSLLMSPGNTIIQSAGLEAGIIYVLKSKF